MRGQTLPVRRLGLIAATAFVMLLMYVSTASAHEHRHVGEYEVSVGFLIEPAILEEPNGLELHVSHGHGDESEPVEGLSETLTVEVIYGDQSMSLDLEPVFGEPGAYKANFIPTAEGAYTFHITGSIEDTPMDESFTGGPDTFSEVEGRAALSFPNGVASTGEIAEDASDAANQAATASTLSIVAIIVGAIGLVAGVVGIVLSRRAAPAARDPEAAM